MLQETHEYQSCELSEEEMKVDQIDKLLKEYEKILEINHILIKSEEQIRSIRDLIDDIEKMININSKESQDIKRNDIAFFHMVKYFNGRKCFLSTIELDTNRTESYGKRLQIKFERELETSGICKDILSASEEEESKEKSKHDDIDNVKSKLLEKVDYCDEGINIMCSSSREFLNTSFTVSATQNPFGLQDQYCLPVKMLRSKSLF